MTRPYLTKLWLGRWWVYVRTRRCYRRRTGKLVWHWGIVSYRRSTYGLHDQGDQSLPESTK